MIYMTITEFVLSINKEKTLFLSDVHQLGPDKTFKTSVVSGSGDHIKTRRWLESPSGVSGFIDEL